MDKGTQIAYIPLHANGNIEHPDVEFGFVTSQKAALKAHHCRFWRKGEPGVLRTTSCSELTPDDMLVQHEKVSQDVVDRALNEIELIGMAF